MEKCVSVIIYTSMWTRVQDFHTAFAMARYSSYTHEQHGLGEWGDKILESRIELMAWTWNKLFFCHSVWWLYGWMSSELTQYFWCWSIYNFISCWSPSLYKRERMKHYKRPESESAECFSKFNGMLSIGIKRLRRSDPFSTPSKLKFIARRFSTEMKEKFCSNRLEKEET